MDKETALETLKEYRNILNKKIAYRKQLDSISAENEESHIWQIASEHIMNSLTSGSGRVDLYIAKSPNIIQYLCLNIMSHAILFIFTTSFCNLLTMLMTNNFLPVYKKSMAD